MNDTFGGLGERSHNFLLVCRHWFEVASCTPEVWSFWGNSLEDRKKRHLQYPSVPLDLVLNGERGEPGTLDRSTRSALQKRAAQDTIRRIHLVAQDSDLLDSIISPLAGRGEIRSSNVESIILSDDSERTSVDVSDFFAYYRFPKLQRLKLNYCTISSWDLIMSRASTLTTLYLGISYPSPAPTTSQILSILSSNHLLRRVSLFGYAVPVDGGDKSSRVHLHHLRELELAGVPRQVFGLLRQLDHPTNMDSVDLTLLLCVREDTSGIIGPYLREHLRRRGKSQSGLELSLSSEQQYIDLRVRDVHGIESTVRGPEQTDWFLQLTIHLDQEPPDDVLKEVTLDLVAHASREEIVSYRGCGQAATTNMPIQLPSLRALHFLHVTFPDPIIDTDEEVFPSLQHITLDHVVASRGDWSALTTFLARRASLGNKVRTLEASDLYPMNTGTMERIRKLVLEFNVSNVDDI